ncbi:unnamed protein product [Cuscuta epithymum]|uniref:Uncharacterized protein n=1 Tax=Cuscuta epithymum TaxID=186058 RepID=A0AAV0CQ26_9ASTE|nr:unnamed protein product [Cuscuta epithymum]
MISDCFLNRFLQILTTKYLIKLFFDGFTVLDSNSYFIKLFYVFPANQNNSLSHYLTHSHSHYFSRVTSEYIPVSFFLNKRLNHFIVSKYIFYFIFEDFYAFVFLYVYIYLLFNFCVPPM